MAIAITWSQSFLRLGLGRGFGHKKVDIRRGTVQRFPCLKVWAKLQSVIALSSGEAELYAASKATAEGLGLQSLATDLDMEKQVSVFTDSSTALSMILKTGLGKAKHIALQELWIQQLSRSRKVLYKKVSGMTNPADLMTKLLATDRIGELMSRLRYFYP